MPDEGGEAANDQLNPDPRENHPLAADAALEEKNVRGVRIEGGREVNEEEAHLVHVAAEMLAGEAVTEFVDSAEQRASGSRRPTYRKRSYRRKNIEQAVSLLHPGPIPRKKVHRGDEEKERENDEFAGVNPAQIGIYFREDLVRVPGFEADVEHAGLIDAAFAFVADAFEHGEIFFAERAFPHRRLDGIEKIEDFGFGDRGVGIALGTASAISAGVRVPSHSFEKLVFRRAIAIVGIGFMALDDVAFSPATVCSLMRRSERIFGRRKSLGENARDLQAGGTESHR